MNTSATLRAFWSLVHEIGFGACYTSMVLCGVYVTGRCRVYALVLTAQYSSSRDFYVTSTNFREHFYAEHFGVTTLAKIVFG